MFKMISSILLSLVIGLGLYNVLYLRLTGAGPLLILLVMLLVGLVILDGIFIRRVNSFNARLLLLLWGIICLAGAVIYYTQKTESLMTQGTTHRYIDAKQ